MESVTVNLFGAPVKAVIRSGSVMFERESFVHAIGKSRARRIFSYMRDAFEFLGDDGVEEIVASGKEHLLCQVVLSDKNSPEELVRYATAWVQAYELLKGKE